MAKIVRSLDSLPFELAQNKEVQAVMQSFRDSFVLFKSFPEIHTAEDEQAFLELCKNALTYHQQNANHVGLGLRTDESLPDCTQDEKVMVQPFLDRLHMSRIGNRMILSHYIAVRTPTPGYVGVLEVKCPPAALIRHIASKTAELCALEHPEEEEMPAVIISGKEGVHLMYPSDHLRYIMFELLINAMRVNIKHHRELGHTDTVPAIKVVIADGDEDIIIKVSDIGGGFERGRATDIWTHLAQPRATQSTGQGYTPQQVQDTLSPVSYTPVLQAGYAFGKDIALSLPVCRLYARYAGGDLKMFPMHGHGTDFYLYLHKTGDYAEPMGGPGYTARNRENRGQDDDSNVWITDDR